MRRLAGAVVTATLITVLLGTTTPARATTPGHNGEILFAADLGLGFQLYAIEPDGTGFHQLTNVYGDATLADWSPNGHQIVFEHDWFLNGKDHGRIVMMNADGSNVHDVTTTGLKHQPAFTPDGHNIVYECECNPDGIFIMRTDGTDRRRLTTNPFKHQTDTDPNVSPNGQTVTFVRHKEEELLQALFAVDIDGTNLRQLTTYTLEVAIKHDWAPRGGHILITPYADYPHGRNPQLATMEPGGTNLRFLTHVHGPTMGAFAGSYSPNGQWIVFRHQTKSTSTFGLFKIHPDGTRRALIVELPFAPRFIDWGTHP